MLISEFETKYLSYLEPICSEAYLRDNRIAFHWLKKSIGDIPINEMKLSGLEHLFATEFGRASHNAARFHRTLKAAFTKAVSWGEITDNPFGRFKLPRIPEKSSPYLKRGDLEKLLSQNIPHDLALLFEMAFYTGLRQAEILNLKWSSVIMEDRIIRVANTESFTTKSKRERVIPINERLLKILANVRQMQTGDTDAQYIFQRNGRRMNGNHVARKFKAAVRAAGLDERLHFHCLRHSFASNLIRAGVNPVHVQKLLGHQNLTTTLRYTHVDIDDLRAAVVKLD